MVVRFPPNVIVFDPLFTPVPPLVPVNKPVMVEVPRATVNPAPVDPPVSVPTEVREDVTTVEFKVVPVSVPAAAVTVADPPSDIDVPLTVIELLARLELPIAVNPTPIDPDVKAPTVTIED